MLRRFVFKSSLPSVSSCGRKNIAEAATNFPVANGENNVKKSGANDSKNSAGNGRRRSPRWKQHSDMPSSKQSMPFLKSGANLGKAQKISSPKSVGDMPSSKQSMPFLKSGANLGKAQKISSPKSVGDHDDNFAELGPSVSDDAEPAFKLVTEVKRIHFSCKDSRSTVTSRKHNSSSVRSKERDQKKENHENSSSIYISNVPQSIKSKDLEKAVVVFGRIKSVSATKEQGDFADYHITFKSVESKDRAAAAKSITVKDCKLSIHAIGTEFLKVKLTNVSWITAEPVVHSKCASLGCVSGLTRTRDGAIEVVFQTNGFLTAENILENLNNVVLDDCQWSAQLLSELDENTRAAISGSHVWIEPQISNLIESYRKQLQLQHVYLDDLDSLHHAILHLKDQPSDIPGLENTHEKKTTQRVIL